MEVRQGSGERLRPGEVGNAAREGLRFPDFVCIGAQKAGTTWLHANLDRHPEVWLAPVKELHYFDQLYVHTLRRQGRDGQRRRRGAAQALVRLARLPTGDGSVDAAAAALIATATVSDDWYGSIFALAPSGSICGEMTPSYALLPDEGIRHLVSLNPDVKILLLVRDPIERALAHLQMISKRRAPDAQGQFEPMRILDVDDRVLARSRYSETLRRYRRHIDDGAIWIGDFDQLAGDPGGLLRSVCAFLGLEFDERLFPEMHQKVNVGVSQELGDAAYERLRDALKPEYDELARIMPDAASRWHARHYG